MHENYAISEEGDGDNQNEINNELASGMIFNDIGSLTTRVEKLKTQMSILVLGLAQTKHVRLQSRCLREDKRSASEG